MLDVINCYERKCKYYVGIIQPDGTELSEVPFCGAFPNGIPMDIAFGNNKHLTAIVGQDKKYVYEESDDWENRWDNIPEDDLKLYREMK